MKKIFPEIWKTGILTSWHSQLTSPAAAKFMTHVPVLNEMGRALYCSWEQQWWHSKCNKQLSKVCLFQASKLSIMFLGFHYPFQLNTPPVRAMIAIENVKSVIIICFFGGEILSDLLL